MFKWILLSIIILPILEVILLIWAGAQVGFWSIIGFVVLTALVGGTIARHQGMDNLKRARQSIDKGQLPTDEIFNGIFIFIAGFLILLPGFITDAIGTLILIPFTRSTLKNWLKAIVQNMMNRGNKITFRRF